MCTGFFFQTKDGKYICGRTLEFGLPLVWKQVTTTHGVYGTMGQFPNKQEWYMVDGINREGLFVGSFFYPHYDYEYSKEEEQEKINLYTGELNLYLLNNCKCVKDVIERLNILNILETNIDGTLFSLHWLVCDLSGQCIVLENKNKKLIAYKNDHGVITNSPSFPEQLENLKNYPDLSKYNKPGSISQGSGAIGLPGDSTALSRFVRANFYNMNLIQPSNSEEGKEALIRLLHNFDIPIGSVQDKEENTIEVTQYTVSYCINDYTMKYAPYGYIEKNGKWVQTNKPVYSDDNSYILILLGFLTILGFFIFFI